MSSFCDNVSMYDFTKMSVSSKIIIGDKMERREMTMKERLKYEVIKKLSKGETTMRRAKLVLSLSERQIYRLKKKYKEKNKEGFIHGNRGRQPVNKKPKSLSEDIVQYYETEYQDFNFRHFKKMLKKEKRLEVSDSFIYQVLTKQNGILSPKARKKTKKAKKMEGLRKKRENKNKSMKKLEQEAASIIALEDAHPRVPRAKYFGERIELDASSYRFFGNITSNLHLSIDGCTNHCTGAYLDYQETLNGYYHVTNQLITKYGCPLKFVTDGRTIFDYKSKKMKREEKDYFTQFKRACDELGIEIVVTSVSQKKPRVERYHQVFQDRLTNELKHLNIQTIEEANEYLVNVFIDEFNEEFSSLGDLDIESVMEKGTSQEQLNLILSIVAIRTFDNGSSIRYKNKIYLPYDEDDKLICFRKGTKCTVIETYDDRLCVQVSRMIYALKELDKYEACCEELGEQKVVEQKEKIPVPSPSSKWDTETVSDYFEDTHKEFGIYDMYNPKL